MASDAGTCREVAYRTKAKTASKCCFERIFTEHDVDSDLLCVTFVHVPYDICGVENEKVKWRIYRLPGSREFWHIDSGPGTQIVNVKAFHIECPCTSVDEGGKELVRAWIEVNMANLYIQNGTALFVGMDYKVSYEAQA